VPNRFAPLQTVARQATHSFLRYYTVVYSSDKVSGIAAHAIGVTLDSCRNAASLKNLYDFYKIDWVQIEWVPHFGTSVQNGNPNSGLVHSCVDYDDAAISDIGVLQSFSTYQLHQGHNRFKVRFQPRVSNAVYRGSTTTFGYTNNAGWVDAAYGDVLHYGWKVVIETDQNASNINQYTAFVTCKISCKGIR